LTLVALGGEWLRVRPAVFGANAPVPYNQHRPHRGIDQRAPNDIGNVVAIRPDRPIERHTACAGLINEYRPAA
jgi:hypothetical protein